MRPAAPVTRIVGIGAVYGPREAVLAGGGRRTSGRLLTLRGGRRRLLLDRRRGGAGSLHRLALAVDAPPVAADHHDHVGVLHRGVLDELADAAEVAGDELG